MWRSDAPRLPGVSTPALQIESLVVRYGARLAVDGISTTAAVGQVTALLGPNGAGKTSTVEVISGLRRPTSGTVRVLGLAPDDAELKPRIGVMLQNGGLYPTARPLEWLRYLARLYPQHDDPRELLERVGLDPATRTTARRLSGGEQQRLKLAAALLPRPHFLVLDEPTAGLDPLARRALVNTVRALRDGGVSILLTTHQLLDVVDLADRIIVMAGGRLHAEGTLDELTGTHDALRFLGPRHLDTATLAAALPEGYGVEEPRGGHYVVHGAPTPQAMAAVTAWCAQHGVLATDISVGHRSLEDILIAAAEGTA